MSAECARDRRIRNLECLGLAALRTLSIRCARRQSLDCALQVYFAPNVKQPVNNDATGNGQLLSPGRQASGNGSCVGHMGDTRLSHTMSDTGRSSPVETAQCAKQVSALRNR